MLHSFTTNYNRMYDHLLCKRQYLGFSGANAWWYFLVEPM